MEISTSPYRPAATPWGRLLLLGVVFAPLAVLVLLPAGLGFKRYVVTGHSMGDGLGRGAIVFERVVPVNDITVGDVITYRPPGAARPDERVTHRVVALPGTGIVTRADASARPDPWVFRPAGSTVQRVEFAVPWVGYAYLVLLDPMVWIPVAVIAGALGALLLAETSRRRCQARGPDRRALLAASTGGDQ